MFRLKNNHWPSSHRPCLDAHTMLHTLISVEFLCHDLTVSLSQIFVISICGYLNIEDGTVTLRGGDAIYKLLNDLGSRAMLSQKKWNASTCVPNLVVAIETIFTFARCKFTYGQSLTQVSSATHKTTACYVSPSRIKNASFQG